MALSYRSVLTTADSEPASAIAAVLSEHNQLYQQQSHDFGSVQFLVEPEHDTDAPVTVTVVPDGASTAVLVERRHPLAVGAVELSGPPTFMPDLLRRLEASTGDLPVHRLVVQSELEAWLNNSAGTGTVVLALVSEESTAPPSEVIAELRRQLGGMTGLSYGPVSFVEQTVGSVVRLPRMNAGGLLYIERCQPEPIVHYLPATVATQQTTVAVRRLRRWVISWQAKATFAPSVEQQLTAINGSMLARADVSEDWLKEYESLERNLEQVKEKYQYEMLDHDETLRELQKVRSRLAYVESRLGEHEQAPIIDMPDELDEVEPDTCFEAIRFARELLPFLCISAVDEPVLKLDGYEKCSVWAKKVWAALVALDSYVSFRVEHQFSGNFLQFCDEPPLGAKPFFVNGIAMRESTSTFDNPQTRVARTFSVPANVHSGCAAYMGAHIKIDQKGFPAPRIHFLDDTARTGRIYVGYLGPHLQTAG